MAASRTKKVFKAVGLLFLAALIYGGWRFGPTIYDFWKAGLLEDLLSPAELRKYQGTSIDNLKAMHVAMMLYHDSEGQFPHSSGWMDALKPRLQTADMAGSESMKKMINPLLRPAKDGVYGYAMNEAASGKYEDDVTDPDKTPLIFDSSETGWNAHGKPEKLLPKPPRQGGNLGISISGKILHLP